MGVRGVLVPHFLDWLRGTVPHLSGQKGEEFAVNRGHLQSLNLSLALGPKRTSLFWIGTPTFWTKVIPLVSDVNKDLTFKAKDKDQTLKAKDQDNDQTYKAKDHDKD